MLAATTVTGGVEVDVRRSGDGKLVLSHDPTLGGHVVCETPWAKLGQLDLGEGHHPALLDEALAALVGKRVQLEVKNSPWEPGFEPDHRLALETADRARPGDYVTGFNWDTLALVHRVFPDVPTAVAVSAPIDLQSAIRHALEIGHAGLVVEHSLLTDPIEEDVEVFAWTVNDTGRAQELVDMGVAGIITDDPGLMVETLRRD